MSRAAPLCFRLPPDLYAAVTEMAEAEGVTTSEWVRDMLQRIVYGQPPGIDEGYMQGRSLGFRMMHVAFRDAWAQMPTDVHEAMQRIQAEARGDAV